MATQVTIYKTADGLTVYDLDVYGSELVAVAGPAGYDPRTINTDELPEGFRWVSPEEWSTFEGDADDLALMISENSISEDDTIPEIVALVVAAGPAFSGGTDESAREVAADWDDYFSSDVRSIEQWIAAGYWSPAAASAARDEGHRPSDRPTINGECAIYALCNNDVTVDEVDW